MIELNSSAYSTTTAVEVAPPPVRRNGLQLVSARPVAAGNELYLRRPISLPFLGFIIALLGTGVATYLQPGASSAPLSADLSLINRLGVVGSTVFALAACAILYRAATTRSPAMVPIAVLLIGPGAWWNWGLFSGGQPSPAALSGPVTLLVVFSAAAIAACLLLEATRNTRWLGVYCGLGSIGLAGAAVLVRIDDASAQTVSLTMMMIVAGLACLYGTLVEIEAVRRQSLEELLAAKAKTETEIAQAEDVLHDLRSGLLSIEAAIGSFDSDLAGPLRTEAARLRQLTVRSKRSPSNFDLVPGLRDLAQARRPSGLMVDVRLPASALVRGEESELLSVVDNLLSNAQRHGRAPIRLEAGEQDGWMWVAVTDSGERPESLQSGRIFRRGHSTHPDGQGIGLSRAQALAERNHGRLVLDSDHTDGTRFVLVLPSVERVRSHPAESTPPALVDEDDDQPEGTLGWEPNFDYLQEPLVPIESVERIEAAEPVVHFESAPAAPVYERASSAVRLEGLEPASMARQPETPVDPQQSVPTSPPPVPEPVPDRPPRTRHTAREPWVWPEPTPDVVEPAEVEQPAEHEPPTDIVQTIPPSQVTQLAPPLPPPSMILKPSVAELVSPETRPVDGGHPDSAIHLDDGTVIDLARSTNEVPLGLPAPSELPTGPVPIQFPGHPPIDPSSPIDLSDLHVTAEAL